MVKQAKSLIKTENKPIESKKEYINRVIVPKTVLEKITGVIIVLSAAIFITWILDIVIGLFIRWGRFII